jgi:hypothetical protein
MSTALCAWPLRRPCLGIVFPTVLALAGCARAPGEISGKVLFKDEPLASGTVSFHGPDGTIKSAAIAPDGTYVIRSCPAGPVTITVESHPRVPPGLALAKGPRSSASGPRERPVNIPDRYRDPKRSDLTYTVGRGQHTFDILLTP